MRKGSSPISSDPLTRRPLRHVSGRLALVTGAGSGIGRATALELAAGGADLVICDIDERALEEVAASIRALGGSVLARRVDVADRRAVSAFAEEVHGCRGPLDILVNNAGAALGASFLDTSLEDWDWIVAVNLFGPIHFCHFFLPRMIERGRGGHVVNVSSLTGFFATEPFTAYATTKFGLIGLSEALRAGLRRHQIGVTAVCPGMIDTAISRNARARGRFAEREMRDRIDRLFRRRSSPPARVARAIVRGIRRNRAFLPVTWDAWLFYLLKRAAPGLLAAIGRWLTAWLASPARERSPPTSSE